MQIELLKSEVEAILEVLPTNSKDEEEADLYIRISDKLEDAISKFNLS